MKRMATKRKHLSNRSRYDTISIDMEEVYRKIDLGYSVEEVARELGVHRSTLYRRHKSYQRQVELLEQEKNSVYKIPRIPPEVL